MTLQSIERATESARPSGPETGGGTAERPRKRATDLTGDPAQGFPSLDAPAGSAFGASLAALLGAERPAEVQGKAIDHRRETIEASRRQSIPHTGRDGGRADDTTESEASLPSGDADATVPRESASGGRVARTGSGAAHQPSDTSEVVGAGSGERMSADGDGRPGPRDGGANSSVPSGQAAHEAPGAGGAMAADAAGRAGAASGRSVQGVNQSTGAGVGAGVGGIATGQSAAGASPASGTSGGGGAGIGAHADGSSGRAALDRLVSIGAARGAENASRRDSPFAMEEPTPGAQVGRGLAQALTGKGGSVTLRLRPEHLGQVTAHVKIENGVVGVRIEASSEEARALLERESSVLRASLESRGMEVGHVRVEISSRSDERTQEIDARHEDRGGASPDAGGDRPDAEDRRERGGDSHGSDRNAWRTDAQHRWATNARSASSGVPGGVDLFGTYADPGPILVREGLVVRLDATA